MDSCADLRFLRPGWPLSGSEETSSMPRTTMTSAIGEDVWRSGPVRCGIASHAMSALLAIHITAARIAVIARPNGEIIEASGPKVVINPMNKRVRGNLRLPLCNERRMPARRATFFSASVQAISPR